ncbi:hypothetical protein [Streptomyces sp. cmx-4-25]
MRGLAQTDDPYPFQRRPELLQTVHTPEPIWTSGRRERTITP